MKKNVKKIDFAMFLTDMHQLSMDKTEYILTYMTFMTSHQKVFFAMLLTNMHQLSMDKTE